MTMRKRIFEILEKSHEGDVISHAYDVFMMIVIFLSLVPLGFKESNMFFLVVECATTGIFIIDYFARWITADMKIKKGKKSFLLYPFGIMAIFDVLSILPTFFLWNSALRVLKAIRILRALRVLKVFKGFRYSKNIEIIGNVFKKQKRSLVTVCFLAMAYILISALVVFNVEPETFPTFFDAVYWATVSLTTVGYGDIYATSMVGKAITMLSAVLGVAIVALPAGIVTAGYMSEIGKENKQDEMDKE